MVNGNGYGTPQPSLSVHTVWPSIPVPAGTGPGELPRTGEETDVFGVLVALVLIVIGIGVAWWARQRGVRTELPRDGQ